jgi:hypothetical protein
MTGTCLRRTAQNHFVSDFSVDEIFSLGCLIGKGAPGKTIGETFGVDLFRFLVYPCI